MLVFMAGLLTHLIPIATLAVAVIAILAIHEIGHLLGGRLARFRALLLIVGPLKLERRPGGWRVGFNRSPALWGGVAASAPTDTRNLRRRTVTMVAGGPLTSLAAGLLILALWWAIPFSEAGTESMTETVSLFILALAAGSLGIGLITLIPGRTSGFFTDGARILRSFRGGAEAEGDCALLALSGLSMGGQRPREWDPALIEIALMLKPHSVMGLVARQMAYLHAHDHGDLTAARDHLDAALAVRKELPSALRPALLAQGAHFAAVHEKDATTARALLDEARGRGIGSEHTLLLAEAALLHLSGDTAKAGARLDRAREKLSDALDRGVARAESEWIDSLALHIEGTDTGSSADPSRA